MPTNAKLTIEQAAEHLGISTTALESFLQKEKLPFTEVDGHLQIALKDLTEYEKTANEARRQTLSELTQEAVTNGTYFAHPRTTKTR